jgi:hypothetical protein
MAERDDAEALALKIIEEAAERDPRDAVCGVLMGDKSLGAYWQHSVLWFESLKDLSGYITEALFVLDCVNDDDQELLIEVRSVAEAVRKHGPTEDARDSLNEYTVDWTKMVWWGSFAQMCRADTEVTKEIARLFREQSRGAEQGPIQSAEITGFIDFLRGLKDG